MMVGIVAYVPVLHQGYLDFFARHAEAECIWLIDPQDFPEQPEGRKDIRALKPKVMQEILTVVLHGKTVEVLSQKNAPVLREAVSQLIMPDDELSSAACERYFQGVPKQCDTVFLRWDHKKSLAPQAIVPDEEVTEDQVAQWFMKQAADEAALSGDWWRQVGAVLVKDERVIFQSHNHHLPSEQQPYLDGDPRGNFHKGEHIDKTTAIHAEAELIGRAAREGELLLGAQLFVTTFPCPACAKLIAAAGIGELYFRDGYAVVDGERVLRDAGVKIVRVKQSKLADK